MYQISIAVTPPSSLPLSFTLFLPSAPPQSTPYLFLFRKGRTPVGVH